MSAAVDGDIDDHADTTSLLRERFEARDLVGGRTGGLPAIDPERARDRPHGGRTIARQHFDREARRTAGADRVRRIGAHGVGQLETDVGMAGM
jgi:hypothetical protein